MGLAEQETDRVNWVQQREVTGSAAHVGGALRQLLAAADAEAAQAAYWQVENHVVAQGTVYGVAEPTVSVLVAALADERPAYIRVAVLELLFQILSGRPATTEAPSLVETCKQRAREGLWLLMREAQSGERDAARDVLALLDSGRLRSLERAAEQAAGADERRPG